MVRIRLRDVADISDRNPGPNIIHTDYPVPNVVV